MSLVRPIAAAGIAAALGLSLAATPSPSAAASEKTDFTMGANGFGVRVKGGDLPINAGDVGYENVGCTANAGKSKTNTTAGVEIPDFGTVGATETTARTFKEGDKVGSETVHNTADVTLYDSPLGSLKVSGLQSVARAYHDSTGFHSETESSVLKISGDFMGAPLNDIRVPTPGNPTKIGLPGMEPLVVIGIGVQEHEESATEATATTKGIWVRVPSTNTRVTVSRARAHIEDGRPAAFFGGQSDAVDASTLGGVAVVGKTPLHYVDCVGTDGEESVTSVAEVPLDEVFDGLLSVEGLSASDKSVQSPLRAVGYSQAEVAKVEIADGRIVIDGVRARANGEWSAVGGRKLGPDGTTLGTITVDGKEVSLDDLGDVLDKLDIPGLLKVDTNVVTYPSKRGIEVVALQLTLLDGGVKSVVNVGHAKFSVKGNR